MMRVNTREALGPEALGAVDAHTADANGFDEPEIAIDGRMLPHEWISARDGLTKTDALDHHSDDFFPRSRDIAWDLAGAIIEFSLAGGSAAQLVARYRARSGDRTITRRLPFYQAAYCAYRLGYSTLAEEALRGTADGARFARLRARYRHSLAALALPRRQATRC